MHLLEVNYWQEWIFRRLSPWKLNRGECVNKLIKTDLRFELLTSDYPRSSFRKSNSFCFHMVFKPISEVRTQASKQTNNLFLLDSSLREREHIVYLTIRLKSTIVHIISHSSTFWFLFHFICFTGIETNDIDEDYTSSHLGYSKLD